MDLNLRGVDDELVKTIKATAASEGVSMKDFVVEILRRDWTAPPQVEKPSVRVESPRPIIASARPITKPEFVMPMEIPSFDEPEQTDAEHMEYCQDATCRRCRRIAALGK